MRTEVTGAHGRAGFTVHTVPAYGYAAALAEMSPVLAVEGSPEALDGVRLTLPEVGWEAPATAPETAPSVAVTARLEAVTQRTPAHVIVERDGREVARIPVTLLPPHVWSHAPEARVLVAAHVVAGDDDVFRLTVDAGAQGEALPDLVRTGAEDATLAVLRRLYDHAASARATYEEPDRATDEWSGASYQVVRAPHHVLDRVHGAAKGTCLDLTLVLAGALECLGLAPLIVFAGRPDVPPTHACLACWADAGRRFRPLVTDAELLRSKTREGELIVLETTGLCGGRRQLAFDEARSVGARLLETQDDVHAVDVLAARPPHGDVRPVRLVHDPSVRAAIWTGEDLRRRLGARSRETLHLLYGLCAVPESLTARLFRACGGSAEAVVRILEASLPAEGHEGVSGETQSYRVCLETARLNARGRGAGSVEEGDVLWAVLDSPSRNVRKVVEAAGSDCTVLIAALAREWRRSREATISRHFDAAPPASARESE